MQSNMLWGDGGQKQQVLAPIQPSDHDSEQLMLHSAQYTVLLSYAWYIRYIICIF